MSVVLLSFFVPSRFSETVGLSRLDRRIRAHNACSDTLSRRQAIGSQLDAFILEGEQASQRCRAYLSADVLERWTDRVCVYLIGIDELGRSAWLRFHSARNVPVQQTARVDPRQCQGIAAMHERVDADKSTVLEARLGMLRDLRQTFTTS